MIGDRRQAPPGGPQDCKRNRPGRPGFVFAATFA
jgi:hypothetical protein